MFWNAIYATPLEEETTGNNYRTIEGGCVTWNETLSSPRWELQKFVARKWALWGWEIRIGGGKKVKTGRALEVMQVPPPPHLSFSKLNSLLQVRWLRLKEMKSLPRAHSKRGSRSKSSRNGRCSQEAVEQSKNRSSKSSTYYHFNSCGASWTPSLRESLYMPNSLLIHAAAL